MNIKKTVVGILKLILIMTIIISIFLGAQETLKLNMGHRGSDSVRGFYELEEDSVEVLFIGASTMFCTADPLVLYEEYGIASYDFGCSAQPFELSYLFMQEALKTQKPKVIALEILSVVNELDTNDADSLNYGLTDLPFSKEKVMSVFDMFRNDKGKVLSYLIPMAQYKDRWQELEKEDFLDRYEAPENYMLGAYTPDKIADAPLDFSSYYEETECELPARNKEIFERMVALCEENGVEFMIFKAPNVGWTQGRTKAVEELAQEYGVPFLDFFPLMEDMGIDLQQDFRDNTHFNRFGSQKASRYLGQYLKNHYELADYRGTETGKTWDAALANRQRDRDNEQMSRIESLPEYMSKLLYEDRTVVFNVTGDVSYMEDFIREVANAFGQDDDRLVEGGSLVVENGVCTQSLFTASGGEYTQDLGTDTLQLTAYSITYNGEIYQLVDDGLTILIYDNKWQQLVDVAGFDVYGGRQ